MSNPGQEDLIMVSEEGTTSDETSESTTDSVSTAPESTTESADTSEGASSETTAPPAPAFKSDYKVKVYDEEQEIKDPFLKGLIKDEASDKQIKELYRKSASLDTYVGRHEKLKETYQQYQETTRPIVEIYNNYQKAAQKGDLDGIFELLRIPNEAIFKYAVQKAEEAQLPQEQRYQIENQKQIQRQKEHLENQNQSLQSQQQQQLSQFRSQELGWVMSRPDVTPTAQAFDAKNGSGAFRKLVIDKGLAHHAATQGREDLSAEQATMEVMKMLGAFVNPANVNGSPAPQQNQLIPQNEAPPIIPNVTGRGSSPVRKQVRSISDLKKKHEELANRSS